MNINIKVKLVALEMLSLLVMGAALAFFSVRITESEMDIRIEETLKTAVNGYVDDVFYLRNGGQEIDITVFEGNTRVDSSIDGVIGTKANQAVCDAVLGRQETYFDTGVIVGGVPYYGYYEPFSGGMIFAGKPKADVKKFLNGIILALFTAAATVYAICSVVSVSMVGTVIKRIQCVTDKITVLASGDLSGDAEDVKLDRADEVDVIAHSTFVLQSELKEIIADINKRAEQLKVSNNEFSHKFSDIATGVKNVSQSIGEIAAGSIAQAEETTSAGHQVADMADVIDHNSDNVLSLEKATGRMSDLSKQACRTLTDLIEMNEKTFANIIAVSRQTAATNNSAEKIKDAVQIIQSIANQTNLLSLNASIEAARAGDAGKGFAVVAEEIRKLAEESSNSAAEIEDTAGELMNNSGISVKKMEELGSDSEVQKEKLNLTQNAFLELNNEVESVYVVSQDIYEQTKRLEDQKNTINGVIQQLAAIAEENAAATEETSNNMHLLSNVVEDCRNETLALADLSGCLQEKTARFKL